MYTKRVGLVGKQTQMKSHFSLTPRLIRRRKWYAAARKRRQAAPSTIGGFRELPTGFYGGGIQNPRRLSWPKPKKVPKGSSVEKVRKGSPPKGAKPLNENWSAVREDWWKGTQHDNGVLVQSTSSNYNFTNVRRRTGTTLPGWKKIIQQGGNATTIFNGTIRHMNIKQPFTHRAVWRSSPTVLSVEELSGFPYWYNLGFGDPSAYDAVALEQASKFFLRRLQETRQQMQGGVFSGEIRETFRMLFKPAKTLREEIPKYLDALAKRRRGVGRLRGVGIVVTSRKSQIAAERKRIKILNKIARDTWLEYSFGWKPLISDINDAVKAIGRLDENSYIQKISAKGSNEVVNYHSGTNEYPIADQFVTWVRVTQTVKTKYDCHIRGAVRVNSTVSRAARNNELFGFTWSQFVPTVWNLLPYSFLVDYFTNIGDILEAAAVNTADIAWTSRTMRAETYCTASASISPKTSNSVAASLNPGEVERFSRVVSRDAGGPIVPQFRWSIPGFFASTPTGETPLNSQWVNMAALAFKLKSLTPFHRS